MTQKYQLLIEPRDPLLARDGRPFKAGQRAKTLDFLLPSTVTGAIRTRAGSDTTGQFSSKPTDVLTWDVSGALLYSPDEQTFFVPAPLDALMLDEKNLFPLLPINTDALSTICNLEYKPVGTSKHLEGKPKGMPKYWYWNNFFKWLENPTEQCIQPENLGIAGPTLETRTHVKIEPNSQTAEDSQLFSTSALEFRYVPKPKPDEKYKQLSTAKRLALHLQTTAPEPQHNANLWSIGGERRLSAWSTATTTFLAFSSEQVQAMVNSIVGHQHCRVILLTPAYFTKGWKPTFLLEKTHTLISASVGRPQVVSGWDYATGKPKATRRLAPAGSVYFIKLEGKEEEIRTWLERVWFQTISDNEQSCKDGFGLAVFGVWNGKLTTPDLSKAGDMPCQEQQ